MDDIQFLRVNKEMMRSIKERIAELQATLRAAPIEGKAASELRGLWKLLKWAKKRGREIRNGHSE
jgi:hypothetical protein